METHLGTKVNLGTRTGSKGGRISPALWSPSQVTPSGIPGKVHLRFRDFILRIFVFIPLVVPVMSTVSPALDTRPWTQANTMYSCPRQNGVAGDSARRNLGNAPT